MARHAGGTVVVCCHGGVINAVLRLALKASAVGDFELFTTNASITELMLIRPGRWRLLRYNDAAHLAGLPRESPATKCDASAAMSPLQRSHFVGAMGRRRGRQRWMRGGGSASPRPVRTSSSSRPVRVRPTPRAAAPASSTPLPHLA